MAPKTNRVVIWSPQPRQASFISCPADDVGFGGARGGGKSDALLADWIGHEFRYGQDAVGMIFRRELTQLKELIERARQIYLPLSYKFHEQDKFFRGPKGGRLRFSYLERDQDADAYQGHSYCVAVGTKIRMADGTLKPIEAISIGERVATLEGSRPVTGITQPYDASCVLAAVHDSAGLAGYQVHPVWHPVLTTFGLTWSRSVHKPRSGEQLRFWQYVDGKQDREWICDAGQERQGWFSWLVGEQTARKVRYGSRLKSWPLVECCVPVVLHKPSLQSEIGPYFEGLFAKLFHSLGRSFPRLSGLLQDLTSAPHPNLLLRELGLLGPDHGDHDLSNVPAYAQSGLHEGEGSQSCCQCDPYFYDERAHARKETGQGGTPLQGDAENKRPVSPSDVSGTILERSRSSSERWVHPYSGEERYLSEEVTSGTMVLSYYGHALVMDLCVEGANHYITECGLINKNTRLYPEEMGTFPSEAPINKLQATLRSGNGVPCQMKGTCNPGGPGHQWVKARYQLDKYPRGFQLFNAEFTNPYTKKKIVKTRIFIPSKVSDNKYLGDDYVANLFQVGSPQLVRAWLEGDWSIIEGAFFTEWSNEKHVIAPFKIPESWTRFRSADWGSAAPFAICWWAVVGDDVHVGNDTTAGGVLHEHRKSLPRGSLICYREWYGASGPNVGLKIPAEDVADRIKELEADDGEINYGVIDPATYASDGGPSIAERMAHRGVFFRRADNARVSQRGAMGGWDQLRARLRGDGERPAIYFFSTCLNCIRTIPMLQHDMAKPEDVDTESDDHCFPQDTLVRTIDGVYPIADLVGSEGLVWSDDGRLHRYRSVRMTKANAQIVSVQFSDGSVVRCTPDHKFLTTKGWVEARCLSSCTLQRCRNLEVLGSISAGSIFRTMARAFIGLSGERALGQYQKASMSIIGMATAPIINWQTSPAYQAQTTSAFTDTNGRMNRARYLNASDISPPSGMAAKQVLNGIAGTIKRWATFCISGRKSSATIAASELSPIVAVAFAQMLANRHGAGHQAQTTSKGNARSAPRILPLTVIQRLERALASVATRLVPKRDLECLSASEAGRADVYCLTVPDTGNFMLANGAIVANCADAVRYGAMSRPYVMHVDKPPEEKILAVGAGTTATLDDIVQAQRPSRLRERI